MLIKTIFAHVVSKNLRSSASKKRLFRACRDSVRGLHRSRGKERIFIKKSVYISEIRRIRVQNVFNNGNSQRPKKNKVSGGFFFLCVFVAKKYKA
jgi:hypothetical protein